MHNRKQRRFLVRPLIPALIFWAVAAAGAQASGAFRTESDAYEACRWKIERDWSQPGLHSFAAHYGRNRRQADNEAFVFWINSRVHNLDTGEIQHLRSSCTSAGFGLVTELNTEVGRWPLGNNPKL